MMIHRMRGIWSFILIVAVMAADAKRQQNHKGSRQEERPAAGCSGSETEYGRCVPTSGDCGEGLRDATCRGHTAEISCRKPCNWKKDISDCKYRFGHWGECDTATNAKTRSGTLKRAMFNAECQLTVSVSKPCSLKTKKAKGEKKSN